MRSDVQVAADVNALAYRTRVRTDDQRERRLNHELTEITPRVADGELSFVRSLIKR
jgi:Asp-tRNA(Asn)/Glu-tRNA(Gln) amidotransferase C subunit